MKKDTITALVFAVFSMAFITLCFSHQGFFDWVFLRHANQASWYIRPLFVIPLCWFGYKRSLGGIFITLFALLTSMFWFPEPETVNGRVKDFLAFEKDWLTGQWGAVKIAFTLLVPLSLFLLCAAFWKRNVRFGTAVIVLMALSKVLWSIAYGGEAGKAVVLPAVSGLLVCVAAVWVCVKRNKRG